jgi:N6-L-threonylcarbamoyladenine synthase
MSNGQHITILAIESSCDETSAAVSRNGIILSNIIAGQEVHARYGGVVPELASRAHQQHILPVVTAALSEAKVSKSELSAVAFTRGPGLIGSLLVGTSFSKGLSLGLDIPLIEVNHMQAHIISNFAYRENEKHTPPEFPFLCLTVSGGHTQLVVVHSFLDMEIIGETQDDAAGEAFDKVAKMIGLPYPGGPLIDKWAAQGNPSAYKFPKPYAPELDFSFSGLKTAVLYFLQKERLKQADFPGEHLADLCASVQGTIVGILLDKLKLAAEKTGIRRIALAGGVSANSGLRNSLRSLANEKGWEVFIPAMEFCTDNAGMIGVYAYHKYLAGEFASLDTVPLARYSF